MFDQILYSGFNFWLIVIAIWTLPWKGVALWRAAKREDKGWFVALLILNTLAILEIIYIFGFSKREKVEKATNPNA